MPRHPGKQNEQQIPTTIEIPDDLKWTSKTTRGGLQVLGDIGYSLFQEIEKNSYDNIQ